MESKGSTSVHPVTKPNLSASNRKTRGQSSHHEKTESASNAACEREESPFSTKVDGEKKKNECLARKRPSTVSGNSRRRSNWEGNENSKGKNNKSWDRGCTGASLATFKNGKQIKIKGGCTTRSKTPNKSNKMDLPESPGSCSLLSLALEAQQQTTATMRLLRNALRKKAEEIQAKLKVDGEFVDVDADDVTKSQLHHDPSTCFFENSYASCLDEIFQAWINLLYLITNLKVTLHRVVMASGTEKFKPDFQSEKAVITQATECVKFFSKLKLKSLLDGFEEVNLIQDPKMKNFQILDFEERISSSFFSELETLSKKAKEMMDDLKKKTHRANSTDFCDC